LSELRKSQKEQFKRKHTQIQSSQKVFIDGLLKKWENESKKNDNDLVNILKEAEEKIKKA
jgi:Mg2+/Co2+ transporter CorC